MELLSLQGERSHQGREAGSEWETGGGLPASYQDPPGGGGQHLLGGGAGGSHPMERQAASSLMMGKLLPHRWYVCFFSPHLVFFFSFISFRIKADETRKILK